MQIGWRWWGSEGPAPPSVDSHDKPALGELETYTPQCRGGWPGSGE